jgi:hypothetical protein
MTSEESKGLLRAAEACGLSSDDRDAIAQATRSPIGMEQISLDSASDWQRAFTYALGCWLSQMDGSMNAAEKDSLVALGELTDLHDLKLKAAASAAFDVACLPGGHKPDRYDFAALEERLIAKLPSLAPAKK